MRRLLLFLCIFVTPADFAQESLIDKVDPQNFRRAMAMLGVVGYVLADMPGRLPRGR